MFKLSVARTLEEPIAWIQRVCRLKSVHVGHERPNNQVGSSLGLVSSKNFQLFSHSSNGAHVSSSMGALDQHPSGSHKQRKFGRNLPNEATQTEIASAQVFQVVKCIVSEPSSRVLLSRRPFASCAAAASLVLSNPPFRLVVRLRSTNACDRLENMMSER